MTKTEFRAKAAFGTKLRQRRKALGLSQRALAELSKTRQVSVSRLETCARFGSPGVVARLERTLTALEARVERMLAAVDSAQ